MGPSYYSMRQFTFQIVATICFPNAPCLVSNTEDLVGSELLIDDFRGHYKTYPHITSSYSYTHAPKFLMLISLLHTPTDILLALWR